ncbi:hypothetical protein ACOMHN_050915 [Nucella lapillus]
MDTVHKEVLDVHHERLVTSLRANDVIDLLLKQNAISKYDYDQLKRTEAQGSRAMNRLLILTLRQRGGRAYPAFQRSLLDSQQKDLHDLLKRYELDLLEAVLTERLRRSQDLGVSSSRRLSSNGEIHDFTNRHTPGPRQGSDLYRQQQQQQPPSRPDSDNRCEPPVPVLQKAFSPDLKSAPKSSRSNQPQSPPSNKERQSPSPSATEEEAELEKRRQVKKLEGDELEKERQVKKLEEEVQELRESYGRMETQLKQQIEQLEKEKQQQKGQEELLANKKGGGCAVM